MLEGDPHVQFVYPLANANMHAVEQIGSLLLQVEDQAPSPAELMANLGQLVKNSETTEIEVAIDNAVTSRIVGSVTLNIAPAIGRMQGMISELVVDGGGEETYDYRRKGHGTRLLRAVHAGLQARRVSEVFAVVDADNEPAAQFFEQAQYERDPDAVVLQRSTEVPISDRALRKTRAVRKRDRQAQGAESAIDMQGYLQVVGAVTELNATDRIRNEDVRFLNGHQAVAIATLAQLAATRQTWFDAQGSPEYVRGLIYELDHWSNERGVTSLNTIVPTQNGLLTSYDQLGFSRRNASVYRLRLPPTLESV